jgi:hypothetical protein
MKIHQQFSIQETKTQILIILTSDYKSKIQTSLLKNNNLYLSLKNVPQSSFDTTDRG